MSGAIIIRSACAADREEIWPLARDLATSFVVEYEAYAGIFDSLVGSSDVVLLVAEVENGLANRIAGYLLGQLHRTFHANGPAVWVEEVMVAPAARGTGVGRALMRAAEDWAGEHGAGYVALASRRAGDFYLALGYEPSATYFKRAV